MNQEEGRVVPMKGWYYDTLPNVKLSFDGQLLEKKSADFEDDKMRSHFDHVFNWRLNEDDHEFVIRFSKKPEAPSRGHINIDVKFDGGLSTQPDGSVLFDGGLGDGEGNRVSKFSLAFEISHESPPDSDSGSGSDPEEEWDQPDAHKIEFFHHPESPPDSDSDSGSGSDPEEEWDQPDAHKIEFFHHPESPPDSDSDSGSGSDSEEEWDQPDAHEIEFFHHPEHKLSLAPENYYNDVHKGRATCDACMLPISKGNARWVYECSHNCDYCVHTKCAQLARTIRHPSHLKHSLKLLNVAPGCSRVCNVCKRTISCGLNYHCAKCDFDLHPECPSHDDAEEAVTEMTPAMTQLRLMQQQMQNEMQLEMAQHMVASIASSGRSMCNLIG